MRRTPMRAHHRSCRTSWSRSRDTCRREHGAARHGQPRSYYLEHQPLAGRRPSGLLVGPPGTQHHLLQFVPHVGVLPVQLPKPLIATVNLSLVRGGEKHRFLVGIGAAVLAVFALINGRLADAGFAAVFALGFGGIASLFLFLSSRSSAARADSFGNAVRYSRTSILLPKPSIA